MSVGFVAFHYPGPAHFEEFVGRVHEVRDFLIRTEGCLGVDCWATEDGTAVVSAAHWESEELYSAAFASVGGKPDVDADFDEREVRPREFFKLYSR
ncbi:antibiotic biosynthesis monooxygenase [Nocardia mexicana]|uniref:Antibiotic biosynthesis monooxygenase n=1 Tax=Nocardia mexicana TaxID=279262 RepID=A0A370GZQ9_9NOCA|nr:antibiotic biosynthesis monooxygenase [Nocardia mexicana]RDI49141.1 antibiotic biosynthesis monooxygenase [Nocardia mexicana]